MSRRALIPVGALLPVALGLAAVAYATPVKTMNGGIVQALASITTERWNALWGFTAPLGAAEPGELSVGIGPTEMLKVKMSFLAPPAHGAKTIATVMVPPASADSAPGVEIQVQDINAIKLFDHDGMPLLLSWETVEGDGIRTIHWFDLRGVERAAQYAQ